MKFVTNGITATSLAEYKDQIEVGLRTIFGADFVLEDETVVGQLVGAIALALAEVDENAVHVANSFNLNTAVGSQLDDLGSILNLERINSSSSTVVLTGTGVNSTEIPAGSQVRAATTRSVFATDADVVIGNPTPNTYTVNATAIEPGPVAAAAGDIREIVNPIVGWGTVNNAAAAVPGQFGETDTAYRKRFQTAYAHLGRDGLENIRSAVSKVADVTDVLIRDNDGSSNVPLQGKTLTPHSVYIAVEHSDGSPTEEAIVLAVGNAILQSKPAGVGTVGGTDVVLAHGEGNRGSTTIRWDWVQKIPLEMTVVVSLQEGNFPANWEALIKDRIVAWFDGSFRAGGLFDVSGLQIGEALDMERLRTPIYSVPGLTLAPSYPTVTRVGGAAVGTPELNQRYTIAEDQITTRRTS